MDGCEPMDGPRGDDSGGVQATGHDGGDVLGVDGVQTSPAADLLAAIRIESISSRVKSKGKARLAELMVLLGESTIKTDSMSKSEMRQYLLVQVKVAREAREADVAAKAAARAAAKAAAQDARAVAKATAAGAATENVSPSCPLAERIRLPVCPRVTTPLQAHRSGFAPLLPLPPFPPPTTVVHVPPQTQKRKTQKRKRPKLVAKSAREKGEDATNWLQFAADDQMPERVANALVSTVFVLARRRHGLLALLLEEEALTPKKMAVCEAEGPSGAAAVSLVNHDKPTAVAAEGSDTASTIDGGGSVASSRTLTPLGAQVLEWVAACVPSALEAATLRGGD